MGLKVTNNAYGTLNAGITSSSTTIVLNAGEGSRFPTLSAGDYFYATLIDTTNNLEIVKVTARSTDTMTVVRGQDSTTARAFSTNDRFELRPVAVMFTEVITKADAAVQKSGDTMTGTLTLPSAVVGSLSSPAKIGTGGGDTLQMGLNYDNSNTAKKQIWNEFVDDGSWGVRYRDANDTGTAAYRLKIDSSGRNTKPAQPFFLARSSSVNVSLSAGEAVRYDLITTNIGGHYNTSTYRFTAPIAGVYLFHYYFYRNSNVGVTSGFYLNGSQLNRFRQYQVGSDETFRGMMIRSLSAGDYVSVHVLDALNNTYGNSGEFDAAFAGYLLG